MTKFWVSVVLISGISVVVLCLFTKTVLNILADSCARRTVVEKLLEKSSGKEWPSGDEDILLRLSAHALYQDIGIVLILTILLAILIWGVVKICQVET
jgi:hypothetical protein